VGKAGARNAGLLATRILGCSDPALAAKVREQREQMARDVEAKDAALKAKLTGRAT
jgi:5-(carboxyamino)imidazole ribonucleotide mutase